MALILTVTEAYATIAEASAYLYNDAVWNATNADDQMAALLWGRYYIDANFDCISSLDTIPDELIYANSLLASDYLDNPIAFESQILLVAKSVSAGPVKVYKKFNGTSKVKPKSNIKVNVLLNTVCGSFSSNLLIRS